MLDLDPISLVIILVRLCVRSFDQLQHFVALLLNEKLVVILTIMWNEAPYPLSTTH